MSTQGNIRLLIVDDLPENLMALEGLLRKEGVTILKARSGMEALEVLLKNEVALAILDVQMPEMDGFALAEHMRSIDRTKGVPIIFLTAGNFDKQRSFKGYEMGAVDFLHKPIEPNVLQAKVEVFLELYRQRQMLVNQRDELRLMAEANAQLLQESRQYAQALEEDDRRKDEFLATLAHELRNPMAPIGNGLQIMRMAPDKNTLDTVHHMMERQFNHLVRLIDDLLDVSRIRQGKIDLRLETLTLQEVLRTAVEASTPFIQAGEHKLHLETLDEDLLLNGDLTRLSQVVSNLLNNAAKYTPQGGDIYLRLKKQNGTALIEVTDNGFGIPDNMLPKVFQLFTQVDKHLERSQGGLGIGLALVKQLVEMHGGTITAASDGLNKGSTFTVSLPLAFIAEPQAPEDSVITEEKRVLQPLRILIVDDNVPSAQTIGWTLEYMGHDYKILHEGTEALEAAKEYRPHVILLDIGLPQISGYDVCRLLRKEKQFENTIIIAQTGWGRDKDRQEAQEAGFNYHLTKPINFSELSEMLEKAPI